MTVTFALATGNIALVVADTRLNFTFRDGRVGVQDSDPIDVTFSDGTAIKVANHFRKIRPVGGDWACGAGFFALVEAGLAALSSAGTTSSAHRILSEVQAKEVPRLEREFNAQRADVQRAEVTYTVTSGGKTSLAGYGFDGANPVPPGSQYVFQTPRDLPSSDQARILRDLQTKLVVPRNGQQLYALIRSVAQAFAQVVPLSHTVSERMEVGVTVGKTNRYRLLAGMSATAAASDREMERLLSPIGAAVVQGGPTVVAATRKVGRNEPCPCGSGRKFKRCHGAEN